LSRSRLGVASNVAILRTNRRTCSTFRLDNAIDISARGAVERWFCTTRFTCGDFLTQLLTMLPSSTTMLPASVQRSEAVLSRDSGRCAHRCCTTALLNAAFFIAVSLPQGGLANGRVGRTQGKTVRSQGLICESRSNPGGFQGRLIYRLGRKPAPMCRGDFVLCGGSSMPERGIQAEVAGEIRSAFPGVLLVHASGHNTKSPVRMGLSNHRRTRKERYPR
jgi:hypothetical protein